MQEVEDKLIVLYGMADVAEGISRRLHALIVVSDGGVALLHGVEFVAEEDGPWFLVGAEDVFDGHPQSAGGLIVALHDEVEDGVGDGAEEPTANAAVRLIPLGIGRASRRGAVDVVLEPELATH